MKKLLSISIALLMLISGMQLTISRHYCGGELADSKISVIGHLASCGMESATDDCTRISTIGESGCCKNNVSVYEVDHNYSPTFNHFKVFAQTILQIYLVPENITFHSSTSIKLNSTDTSPPENALLYAVSLSKICVFLI